ncbi:MAG: tyrosine-type recombinase/integrase [gamma proteobacterium endosymbiont of Lamellibrachia anaximandri]|nr:tyrosine-type recombinase/integrase [gamma proteobacterium endosymbiont of Lamellibrachia anaximandri]MBL3535747.1 tyrosine-type recombinase/integrase [gamma proteobacterium endosymbiont of Lamellibrachia anaximandri]
METNKLTDLMVRRLKPGKKVFRVSDGKGLFLQVEPSGSKYWRMAYRYLDKQKQLALGVYPEVTIAEARRLREAARQQLRDGKDPSLERKRKKAEKLRAASNSFEVLALEWHRQRKGDWEPAHAERVLNWMKRDLFPDLGRRPVTEITPADVLMTIRKIESRGALDVAKRQRARVPEIYRYAIQTGRAAINPAADLVGVIKSERVNHRPALGRENLGPFLRELDQFEQIKEVTRLALRLLILTFVRPGELRGGRWSEIDFERKEWRIPAERMKMRAEHIVPLSSQAEAILEQLKPLVGNSDYLFPSDRSRRAPMSENALSYVMKRMDYQGKATPHGFRATASTILNETGFKPDVIERQLAHIERNKVRAAYNRAEYLQDRRKMMDWWGDFIDATQNRATIIPLHMQAFRS